MITNILLGLILGIVITSFIILNNKINKIDDYVRRTFSNTNVIENDVDNHYKLTDLLLDRCNNIDNDIQNLIIAEHRLTRKQIEKQAKISSKINPKQKQSKSTQK